MNAITKRIVSDVAEKYPELWDSDKTRFRFAVKDAHEADMADYYGYQYHLRALHLYDLFAPCYFETVDGGRYLKTNPHATQKGYYLAGIADRIMLKAANDDPLLRLDDYADFAERIINPQRNLF